MQLAEYDFLKNLIQQKIPSAIITDIQPYYRHFKNSLDFNYYEAVIYYGLFNLSSNSSLAVSLSSVHNYELITRMGITNAFLFDKLNAVNVLFTGYQIYIASQSPILQPAEFNADFSADFLI